MSVARLWPALAETAQANGRLGQSDCERLLDGAFLAQPVNAVSSLAYVAAGLWVIAQARTRDGGERTTQIAFGAAVLAVGIGSVAFHGPQPPGARWVHDLAIVAVFAVVVGRATAGLLARPERASLTTGAVLVATAGLLMAVRPDAGLPLTGLVAVVGIGGEAWLHRTTRRKDRHLARAIMRPPATAGGLGAAAALVAAGAFVNAMGRTGAPWCDPTSLVQPHAVWHVLTALALGVYGRAAFASDPFGRS